MTLSKRGHLETLNERIAPHYTVAELDTVNLKKLLDKHYSDKAEDPRWMADVARAMSDAHLRSRIASNFLGRASDDDVLAQLRRVVNSSDELLEALSGTTDRRQQIGIAGRLWFTLKDLDRPSELDQAFHQLRKLNERSRRILRKIERADSGEKSVRSGAKPDHYLDSFVMCLGCLPLLGGASVKMPIRLEKFITDYLVTAGRKHTTQESVRKRWNRVKRKGADPWREFDQQVRGHNGPNSGEI